MLPHETKRCAMCVLSASFPHITFDAQGVCSFCRNAMFHTLQKESILQAQSQILQLFDTRRGLQGYDALVCYSGGKDSTYTLMLAVQHYRLKVLAFTLDNGFLPDQCFTNIRRTVDTLGVDHVIVKPSVTFMKALFKATSCNPVFSLRSH
ncbi:MAG: hypothetical protein JW795_05335, partial [Chitinivibrionales bacterium]|nr:hypothetical protein [Chitinivibrionales bacterium]